MTHHLETGAGITRRRALQAAAALASILAGGGLNRALAGDLLRFGPAERFSFERLKRRAAALAAVPFEQPPVRAAATLQDIDYDAHNRIRYRPDATLWGDDRDSPAVRFFHLGRYFTRPVDIHVVDAQGGAHRLLYSPALFERPSDSPARDLPDDIGFAGMRIMDAGETDDWLAFLGASYFRTSGPFGQFGLSARGLAVDTAIPDGPEEFPRFTEFWLEPQGPNALTVYALLDSPGVAGAYRILSEKRDDGIVQEIETSLHMRREVSRLGIAPLTSMYWYGENARHQARDWRPEIHDSDGLSIWTGSGERIWRPLNNPPRVMVNAFADDSPKGFGLMQRDRDFEHYEDDGVFYDRRASLWVEPLSGWGKGAVELVELPTRDETFDNIVAFWVPQEKPGPGAALDFAYRLHWLADNPFPPEPARLFEMRIGEGGVPGQERPKGVTKFVLDFEGEALEGLDRDSGVEARIEASRGTLDRITAYPVVGTSYWRVIFDLAAEGDEPVDLRAFVARGGEALSETVIYQFFPRPFLDTLSASN